MMVHQYGRYLLRRNTSTSVTFQQSNLFPYYICKEEVDPFTSSLFLKLKGEVISAKPMIMKTLYIIRRKGLHQDDMKKRINCTMQDDMKKRMNSFYSSNRPGEK